MQGMADFPEILEIIKTPDDKKNFGGSWHTDQMFSPQPAMGTILYALEVPSAGGDTMFTNQYLAYESLSDGMKRLVEQAPYRLCRRQLQAAWRPVARAAL